MKKLFDNDSKKIAEMFDVMERVYSGNAEDRAIDQLDGIRKEILAYVAAPAVAVKKAINAFSTTSDMPELSTNSQEIFRDVSDYDMGYEAAFRTVTVDAGKDHWEILNTKSGLEFVDVPEGGQLSVNRITGDKVRISVKKYGGAIGWSDEFFRFRQFAIMEQLAEEFRDKYWADKANRHYALIKSGANATPTSWASTAVAATDPQYQLIRDINTIENAASALTDRLKNVVGNVSNSQLILFARTNMRMRVLRALNTQINDVPGASTFVTANIVPVFTYNSNLFDANTDAFLVLPGRKIQKATVLEPTTYNKQDILSLSYIQAVWSYYGAGIGFETGAEQIQKLQFA